MRKKAMIVIVAVALLIGLVAGGKYAYDFMYYKEAMASVTIGSIDPGALKDGSYLGSYDAKIISAKVRVTVKDGEITDIELLEHKYDRGGPAVAVIDEILKSQSLDVDAVSGATNSSKTIMKAVENALTGADDGDTI